MKKVFSTFVGAILLAVICQGCVMICPSKPHSFASGKIKGKVVDAKGRPVARAEVTAIYMRGWTTWCPPAPNGFVAGTALTDGKGIFLIVSKKRIDALSASSKKGALYGNAEEVHGADNLIILRP